MLLLENFLAIMGLIAIFALVNEYFDVIAAVIGVGLAIVGVIYAYNNLDPTTFSELAGIAALFCAAILNGRRVQRNKRRKAVEAITKASAPVKDGPATGQDKAVEMAVSGSPIASVHTQPVVAVDTRMKDGKLCTRYSDGSFEMHFPEGRVRYYDDGSIEMQTPAGPVRLRTATEMLNFMAQSESTSGQNTAADQPASASVIKSGVVDGMAYAIYSDGSIEAQLPNGPIKFASVVELREHLERTG